MASISLRNILLSFLKIHYYISWVIYVVAGNTSADDVREKFEKMDMNDQETVALV